MKDAKGNTLAAGQRIRRIVNGRAVYVGQEYAVQSRKWDESDESESLIADGGFIVELITPGRATEYEVIE